MHDASSQEKPADSGAQPGEDLPVVLKGPHHARADKGVPAVTEPADFGPSIPEGRRLFYLFFMAMLVFSIALLFYVLKPFLHSVILACVFTAITYPIYNRCLAITGHRKIPAALIIIFCIALFLAVLVTIFVVGLIPQAKTSIAAVNQWLGGSHLSATLNQYIEPLLVHVQAFVPELAISINDINDSITSFSARAGQLLISSASSLVGNTVSFLAQLLLTLLIMFFLFIDGPTLLMRASYLLPMRSEQTGIILESMRRMSRAVLIGGFSVAVLQGIVGGIGLAIVGIPPLFWGTVMVFAALVPVVGTGLVWGPAVVYLFIVGNWQAAVFLLLWCGVLVTSIDSILRPLLMRGESKLPVLFLFMSILGGVNVFGMLGILYGPLILGLVAVMLNIYAEDFQVILADRTKRSRVPANPEDLAKDREKSTEA